MKEIGKILKEKRLKDRLDLEVIHKATKIQPKYLEAIEDGDIKAFSAEIYYKTFMKSYAKYLGFNPEVLVKQYENGKNEEESNGEDQESKKFSVVNKDNQNTPAGRSAEKKPADTKKILLTVFIAACLLGIFIYLNGNISSFIDANEAPAISAKAETPAVQTIQQEELKTEKTVTTPAPVNSNKSKNTTQVPVKKTTVTALPVAAVEKQQPVKQSLHIEAVENVWIKVDADGKEVFQGTLIKGSGRDWQSDDSFTVRIGYTPGIKMSFNGETVDVIKGSVQDVNTVVLKRHQ